MARRRMRFGLLVGTLLVAACSGTGSLKVDAPPGVDLSGDWQLDPGASDDPRAAIAAQRAKMAQSARRSGPPAGGYPRTDDPLWESDQREMAQERARSAAQRVQVLARLLESPLRITVVHTAAGLAVRSEDGTDDFEAGGHSIVSFGSGAGERTAGWRSREFVVATRAQDGTTQERSYGVDPSGHLVVVTKLSGGSRAPRFTVRSIYLRASGQAPGDAPQRVPAT